MCAVIVGKYAIKGSHININCSKGYTNDTPYVVEMKTAHLDF